MPCYCPTRAAAHLLQRHVGQDDGAELLHERWIQSARVVADRHVLVELCQPWRRHCSAWLADVLLTQEELRAEVGQMHGAGVVQRHGLDAAQHHVLGDLDAQALEAHDQHCRRGHAAHGLVPQHVELPAVERLVDGTVALLDVHRARFRRHLRQWGNADVTEDSASHTRPTGPRSRTAAQRARAAAAA